MTLHKRHAVGLALLVPIFLLITFVDLIPELWALVMSMANYSPGAPITYAGLENYQKILGDPNFKDAFLNTIRFVIFGVTLQLTLGTGVALLFSRQFWGQKLWIALILAPMAMSPAILGTTWKYLFNSEFGPINFTLYQMGIEPIYWFTQANYAFAALLLVYTWNHIPGVFILVYPALISIPPELIEAAKIDGANKLNLFWYVIMPLIRPALLIALIFRTIISLRAFGEILVLTKGG
ncbi:MAG: sugar ABC transporter permease, partial [Anaerolineae bacterium]|nr:sugar ABC transporter permease [Anaerolineae bacterium]